MLDAPPSLASEVLKWVLRLGAGVLFAALMYWGFNKLMPGAGLIGLALSAPIFGVLFARPLIDAIARTADVAKYHALTEKSGFRTSFKGTSLHIDEWLDVDDEIDGKEHLCVNLRDLLNASMSQDKAGLRTRLADVTVKFNKLDYVRIEPLAKRLAGNAEGWDGSVVINDHLQRLGRHLGQQVLLPWLRKKGRRLSLDAFGSLENAELAKLHIVPTAKPPGSDG